MAYASDGHITEWHTEGYTASQGRKIQMKITAFGTLSIYCVNLQRIGWSWSHGLQVVPRPTQSRCDFLISTLIHFFKCVVLVNHVHWAVQWFGPTTIGSPQGGTIYPSLLDLLRSIILISLAGSSIYFIWETAYDFFVLIGVGVFNQHPLQWPPLLDPPWLSSSLTELWARRWH